MNAGLRVDPQAQAILDQIAAQAASAAEPDHAPTESERAAMVRHGYAGMAGMGGEPEDVAGLEDHAIEGSNGSILLSIYRPRLEGAPQPVLLWFHGGSFVEEAGVTVDRVRYPGMIHGFFQMAGVVDASRALIDRSAAALQSIQGAQRRAG